MEDMLDDSLPAHVASLAQARSENAAETAKLNDLLKELEVQLQEGKQNLQELTVEANTIITQICSLEEEGSKAALRVIDCEKEVSKVMAEVEDLKTKLKNEEKDCYWHKRKLNEWKKKMESHKLQVIEAEKNSQTMRKINTLKKEIDSVKDLIRHEDTLLERNLELFRKEGKTMEDSQWETLTLDQDIEQDRQTILSMKIKLDELQNKRFALETANKIVKKKNAALLTRLRKQVSEQKEKHQRLSSYIDNITVQIESINSELSSLPMIDSKDEN